MPDPKIVNVRYLIDDVNASVDFYTSHFGFTVGISSPAFADGRRGNLRLLLYLASRCASPDRARPSLAI